MRGVFSSRQRTAYRVMNKAGLRHAFYSWYRASRNRVPEIEAFRNRHQGQRCFILGGGPSLKQHDPALLADEFTFGVNGIFLIYDWLGFEPTYYAVEDFLVYHDRFQDIKERVSASTCFFPLQFKCHGFDRPNHHYYRGLYEFAGDRDWPEFSTDPARLLWIGGTVTYICMQLAYFMGFEEVILLGMDHSYTKPVDVVVRGNDWTSQSDDPNHFHPDYFGQGYRWHDPRTDRMELAYRKARKMFERDDRRIVNASVGGKLEVFDRVDYRTLF
jgi:hypothetical protein